MSDRHADTQGGMHARHSQYDTGYYPLRNGGQPSQSQRDGSSRIQWKKEGARCFRLGLLCLASLNILFLGCVEGFSVPEVGGLPKQRHDQLFSSSTYSNMRLEVVPLKSAGDDISSAETITPSKGSGIDTIDTENAAALNTNSSNPLLLNFNASGSIGSLLMQMQKKEAELRLMNKSATLLFSEDQALNLDAASAESSVPSKATTEEKPTASQKSDLFSWIRKQDGDTGSKGSANRKASDQTKIDDEIAMELDNSVSIRITNSVKDITILGPPEVSRIKRRTAMDSESTLTENEDDMPTLSKPQQYDRRIGRDMRHIAVSTASCIDSVEEWQLFCQQSTGGLEPLIECIRDGAKSIREGNSSPTVLINKSVLARKEENFRMASSACKVLRDLSALSLDLGAVITDGLLRANAAYKKDEDYTLMDDMCTILRHADEFLDIQYEASDNNSPRIKRRRFGRQKKQETGKESVQPSMKNKSRSSSKWSVSYFRNRREARLRCKLYVTQLLLAMTCASDSAVDAIRSTEGLQDALLAHSSYARKERRRRWMRYPGEKLKSMWLAKQKSSKKDPANSSETKQPEKKRRQPFIEAASLKNDLNGRIKGTANQVLAAIGYNEWVPKIPGQKGLRILCLDGGGSRGMTSVVAMKSMVDSLGGMEVADCFDMVVGTSTGAIIAFLVGLNLETSEKAVERYDQLISKIFTKSALSTPLLLFTTASYDESTFMNVLTEVLGDYTMLDSRANPAVPLVFAVTSKMSSNPTHIALFRNYNYNGGELPDPFVIRPDDARENLDLPLKDECKNIRLNSYPKKKGIEQPAPGTITPDNGSRHPGSFRVLKKYALRASTAAPTVFKPVLMGGEMYCDGGIVASNPSAIAIHEARSIFPDVPIELVVSIGTGGFTELKSEPKIGWDGIIGQIINSATDGEQIHHLLEDVLGDGTTAQGKLSVSNTSYMRFNPTLGMPDEFPIDVTDPEKLEQIKTITRKYMTEPEQQRKLKIISDILKGRRSSSRFKWSRD